ncbi:hypothetical protein [Streptomyces sp. NPDC037389]
MTAESESDKADDASVGIPRLRAARDQFADLTDRPPATACGSA